MPIYDDIKNALFIGI